MKQENSNDKIEVNGVSVPLSDNAFYVPFHLSMISKIIIGPKVDFLGQRKYLPDMLYDFFKENDDECSGENEYEMAISKKDIELTKLSYR